MRISRTEKHPARIHACPRCRGSDMRGWRLPHPFLLHWVLNPVLAFHELVLGQRLPCLQLVCNSCAGPTSSRTFVPCPSCAVVHDAGLWAGGNAYGHWLGWICPTCSKRIPCLRNVASLVVLALTAPLWYLPHLYYFRDRPTLKKLRAHPLFDSSGDGWRLGLAYGSFMWAVTTVLPQLLDLPSGKPLRWRELLMGALLWYSAGLIFGLVVRLVASRKTRDNGRRT
jgi:hypothetical protein